MQQDNSSILESHSSSRILEFEQGNISRGSSDAVHFFLLKSQTIE